jgi:hypothetical protein
MTLFKGHINQWFEASEPDYYILFLKAWIPFNAWYVSELPQFNKKDGDIIRELQDNPDSKPRKIIENYISQNNHDSDLFKSYLSELHFALERKVIMHNNFRLSFRTLQLSSNSHTSDTFVDSIENVYKVEKTDSYFHAFIQAKSDKTLLNYKSPIYNIQGLKMNSYFIRLNNANIQNKILELYELIDPDRPSSIISDSDNASDFIIMKNRNQVKFKNEPDFIAQACIRVLYSLRCMLFHGEIDPSVSNKPVYENAYNLLRLIIKDLR